MISDSPAQSASEAEPRPPNPTDAPLLTVIYPVFDTRGEATDRIRLWTQDQDLAPDRYCVVVVAGTRTELDEARLRKVLRNHDVILRAPGDGRENDYWSAGASEARTPWLLFVASVPGLVCCGLSEKYAATLCPTWAKCRNGYTA